MRDVKQQVLEWERGAVVYPKAWQRPGCGRQRPGCGQQRWCWPLAWDRRLLSGLLLGMELYNEEFSSLYFCWKGDLQGLQLILTYVKMQSGVLFSLHFLLC